jgi:hypothetical protein
MEWSEQLARWECKHQIRTAPPVPVAILSASTSLLRIPGQLHQLYASTNGLVYEWFTILPLEDPHNMKRSWDSLQRANDVRTSRFEVDPDFLQRFLVFADIGGGKYAALDRSDCSIWYEEANQLHQLDVGLADFIETVLREGDEL